MKMESQQQRHVFYLATQNVFIRLNEPFKIQHDMIETRNFIPEALMIHHFQASTQPRPSCGGILKLTTKGEKLMAVFQTDPMDDTDLIPGFVSPLSLADDDADDDEEDWDEEDEDWEDEDEDWDEDDEDWDEEDEDWDDEDEEDFDDEDDEWNGDEEE